VVWDMLEKLDISQFGAYTGSEIVRLDEAHQRTPAPTGVFVVRMPFHLTPPLRMILWFVQQPLLPPEPRRLSGRPMLAITPASSVETRAPTRFSGPSC
jgi:hypothetical protein